MQNRVHDNRRQQNKALNQILNRLGQIDVELSLMDVRLGELRLSERPTGSESRLVVRDRERLDAARAAVSALRAD